MNTINTNNSILNATNYKQTNATVNTSKNNITLQQDSFIKSANSLVPETYTKEDSKNISQAKTTSTIPDIDLNSLTKDQMKLYFGFAEDNNGNAIYLPIIHASDEVKKAWIATVDEIEKNGGYLSEVKMGMAIGCGNFIVDEDSSIGKKMSSKDFFNAIKITIDENLTGKYTYGTESNRYGIINGQKAYAQQLQDFYDIFEAFYKEYNK